MRTAARRSPVLGLDVVVRELLAAVGEPVPGQLCDQPDLSFEEYDRRVRSLVEKHRFAVQSVSGSLSS